MRPRIHIRRLNKTRTCPTATFLGFRRYLAPLWNCTHVRLSPRSHSRCVSVCHRFLPDMHVMFAPLPLGTAKRTRRQGSTFSKHVGHPHGTFHLLDALCFCRWTTVSRIFGLPDFVCTVHVSERVLKPSRTLVCRLHVFTFHYQ